ncbi:hypothetical protein [uncultured Tessaracoccus sp.]|uniref:hypothetical protein n=1 Tax=uncultured Tessaracoccus sp. TaxID=905023 RepID=UPI002636B18C|nr:hypothetical protein [uncultured Tessaracoccus sp.]
MHRRRCVIQGTTAIQLFIGARRSPLHERDDVLELVRAVQCRACMRLVGLMVYETQIASIGEAEGVVAHWDTYRGRGWTFR